MNGILLLLPVFLPLVLGLLSYFLPIRSEGQRRLVYSVLILGTTALAWLLGLGFYLVMMTLAGGTRVSYFPKMKLAAPDAWSLSAFLAWGGLCFTPVAVDWLEERRRKEEAKA